MLELTAVAQFEGETFKAAEFAARAAYGRLLAYLSVQWRDLAAAEDALSEAFLQALKIWPSLGVPNQPEAWLLSVARRKLIDAHRRARRIDFAELDTFCAAAASDADPNTIPEMRLALMLLCAHPSIDPSVRAALMLQTVLGIEVRSMASAFLLSPEALTKRLTRAKRKIRDAGISFDLPTRSDLPARMHDVLEAIYAAYFLGSDASQIDGDAPDTLSQEGLYLADMVVALEPEHAEALGLLALMCFCEARRPAQISEEDGFIPLAEQNTHQWHRAWIGAGHQLLARAHHLKQPGVFQTEAAIQAAHCSRLDTGFTPWAEIANLYEALSGQGETLAVRVGLAIAKTFAEGDGKIGLKLLGPEDQKNAAYMPYWLARSHCLSLMGENALAIAALRRTIGLSTNSRMRRSLLTRLKRWDELLGTSNRCTE